MKRREDIIKQIMEVTFNYHMRYAMDVVPKEIYDWIKSLLRKLNNTELAREARKCGIQVKARDIEYQLPKGTKVEFSPIDVITKKDLKKIRFLPDKKFLPKSK